MSLHTYALTTLESLKRFMRKSNVDFQIPVLTLYNSSSDATAATYEVTSTTIVLIVTGGANAGTNTLTFADADKDTLDELAGAGYVVLRQKVQGLKIADAPTGSLSTSDWTRLSTVRIAKAIIDGVRNAVEPFLGEGMSDATRASMKQSVENVLMAGKREGYLQDYRPFEIIQTPQMEVQGKADINLTLIPAFELRQVTLSISLSKSG